MQGMSRFIPTADKIRLINKILRVGFDTVDFGSFVSPKAVPQMSDTALVLEGLDLSQTSSKLLAIVANVRGGEQASTFEQISYLGFPLSISETFQKRNTNRSIAGAFETIDRLQDLCSKCGQKLVVYLSMGFGNPYGDPYNAEILAQFTSRLVEMEVKNHLCGGHCR